MCPDSQNGFADPWSNGGTLTTNGTAQFSYAFNYRSDYGVRESAFPEPASALIMADSGATWWDCNYQDQGCGWRVRDWCAHEHGGFMVAACPSGFNDTIQYTEWHTGKNNNVFEDGHCKAAGWSQITWGELANQISPSCNDGSGPQQSFGLSRCPTSCRMTTAAHSSCRWSCM